MPNFASQMRVAFSSIAWNTGSSSPGDELMTRNTSAVAVCCSSDSVSSRVRSCSASNSRTFSSAMTAWSAKVADEFDLLVGETLDPVAHQHQDADRPAFAQQRHAECGVDVFESRNVGHPELGIAFGVFDLDGFALNQDAADGRPPIRLGRNGTPGHVLALFRRVTVARGMMEKFAPRQPE